MAVVLRRNRYLLRNAAFLYSAPARWESGLPLLKIETFDNTLQLRSAVDPDNRQRPLVVLFGWLLAKRRHLNKYGNLYLSKGFDVLSVQVPPAQILWPTSAQKKIGKLLSIMAEHCKVPRPILVHGFSVGGYLYGELLVKMEKHKDLYGEISQQFVGQVFDSPVDYEGVPRGFSNVIARSDFGRSLTQKAIEFYLRSFYASVTHHYIQSSAAVHNNALQLPSLFLYSRADPIGVADIIEGVMEKWRQQGLVISHKCWDNSPHVSHFHHHPDEYIEALLSFLDTLGLSTPEQQDVENGKLMQAYIQAEQVGRSKRK